VHGRRPVHGAGTDYRTAYSAISRNSGGWKGPDIDRNLQPHYIACMAKKTETSIFGQEVERLEQQLEALLTTIDRLVKENRSLRTQQETLTVERATLLEKHDLVRHRVEGIVTRLKSLETGA
jgi:cell division protein ZapB